MSKELKRALLKYFESLSNGKCAPYDWSFEEQELIRNIVSALSETKEEI